MEIISQKGTLALTRCDTKITAFSRRLEDEEGAENTYECDKERTRVQKEGKSLSHRTKLIVLTSASLVTQLEGGRKKKQKERKRLKRRDPLDPLPFSELDPSSLPLERPARPSELC